MDNSSIYLGAFVVNCLLALVTLYLLAAFCFFEYSTRYWNCASASLSTDVHNRISRILRILCIAGVAFSFMHHICEVVEYFLKDSSACQSLGIMWLLTYALGILTVYVFLWQRQRWLYESPALKHLFKGCLRIFAWIVLVFFVVSAIMIFLAGSRMIFFSSCGANPDQQKRHLYNIILAVTLLTLTVAGQIQLLILFIIPLRSHVKKASKSFDRGPASYELSSGTGGEIEDKQYRSGEVGKSPRRASRRESDGIMLLVRRCLVLATVNMVFDIIAALVTISVENASGKIVYDINILFSVLCCLGSFKTWRQMIFPWRRTREEQKRRERLNTLSG